MHRFEPAGAVHGTRSKKMIYEVYWDYIEGLEEDFWQILEYYGRDFAQPKTKASTTMMEYQNGQAFVLPYQLPAMMLPEKTKPRSILKTFMVKVLVKVGAIKKESLRIPFSYLERETRFELATSTLGRLHSTTELFPQCVGG